MKLSKLEKETIINYNEAENEATIYTCSPTLMKRLNTLAKKRPDLYKLGEENEHSKTYTFPKKLISIRVPKVMSVKELGRLGKERQKLRQK